MLFPYIKIGMKFIDKRGVRMFSEIYQLSHKLFSGYKSEVNSFRYFKATIDKQDQT